MKQLLIIYQYVNSFGRLTTETQIVPWNPGATDAEEILFFHYLECKTPKGSTIINIIDLTTLMRSPVPVQSVAPPMEYIDGLDSVPSIRKPKHPGRGERI